MRALEEVGGEIFWCQWERGVWILPIPVVIAGKESIPNELPKIYDALRVVDIINWNQVLGMPRGYTDRRSVSFKST